MIKYLDHNFETLTWHHTFKCELYNSFQEYTDLLLIVYVKETNCFRVMSHLSDFKHNLNHYTLSLVYMYAIF